MVAWATDALDRLFSQSECVGSVSATGADPRSLTTIPVLDQLAPDKLADFEERTFRQWDRASLSALRIAIDRRRQQLLR